MKLIVWLLGCVLCCESLPPIFNWFHPAEITLFCFFRAKSWRRVFSDFQRRVFPSLLLLLPETDAALQQTYYNPLSTAIGYGYCER